MAFDLTADQRDLAQGMRMLCSGRVRLDDVRHIEESGRLDRGGWRELVRAGVFGLRVPEASGGLGLGIVESTLVFEELAALCCQDLQLDGATWVRCLGKGRKARCTPLTRQTRAVLQEWLGERRGLPTDPLFPNLGCWRLRWRPNATRI